MRFVLLLVSRRHNFKNSSPPEVHFFPAPAYPVNNEISTLFSAVTAREKGERQQFA